MLFVLSLISAAVFSNFQYPLRGESPRPKKIPSGSIVQLARGSSFPLIFTIPYFALSSSFCFLISSALAFFQAALRSFSSAYHLRHFAISLSLATKLTKSGLFVKSFPPADLIHSKTRLMNFLSCIQGSSGLTRQKAPKMRSESLFLSAKGGTGTLVGIPIPFISTDVKSCNFIL